MVPQEEEEEEKTEEAAEGEEGAENERATPAAQEDKKASALSQKKGSVSKESAKDSKTASGKDVAQVEVPAENEEGEDEEENKEEPIKFLENDYMDKAEMLPPKDPFGSDTMHPDLIISN